MQYFEKRYYDSRIGKFTTEDPVFWEVGVSFRPAGYFFDPQQWNSYSYVRNNPINLVDPTGEIIETGWDLANVGYDAGRIAKNTLEMAYEGARNFYGTVTNNQQLIDESRRAWEQDARELEEGLIDASFDSLAAATPCVPAGMTKVIRMGEKTIKTVEDLFNKSRKMNNVKAGLQRSITGDANKIFDDLAKNYNGVIKTETNGTKYFQTKDFRINLRDNSPSGPTLDVKNLSTNKVIKYRVSSDTSK